MQSHLLIFGVGLYMYYENRTRGTHKKTCKKEKRKSKQVQLTTNTCTSCQSAP